MNTTLLAVILASVLDAVKDQISQHNALQFIDIYIRKYIPGFVWFDFSLSWINKYKIGHWVFVSMLVFVTDAWHFCKYLQMYCIFVAIGYSYTQNEFTLLVYSSVFAVVYMSVFEASYQLITKLQNGKNNYTCGGQRA